MRKIWISRRDEPDYIVTNKEYEDIKSYPRDMVLIPRTGAEFLRSDIRRVAFLFEGEENLILYIGLDKDKIVCDEWFLASKDGSFPHLYELYVTESHGVYPYEVDFPPHPNQYSPLGHKSRYVVEVDGWKNGGEPIEITDLMPALLDTPKLKLEAND